MRVRSSIVVLSAMTLPVFAQTNAAARPAAVANSAIHNVFWQPDELHQGSPIFVTVELERPAVRVTGNFVNKPITFFADSADKKTWHALAGVDLEANPGDYGLDVTATLAGGRVAHSIQQVTIAAGDFKTGDITVPEDYVNPSDAEQKQIARGDRTVQKVS